MDGTPLKSTFVHENRCSNLMNQQLSYWNPERERHPCLKKTVISNFCRGIELSQEKCSLTSEEEMVEERNEDEMS